MDTKCTTEKSKMLRLSKASRSTNDASASRANAAGWQKHEHSDQNWHTKHQTVGAVNGATRLTPEISAPKAGLAAEHRRNTAFLALTNYDLGSAFHGIYAKLVRQNKHPASGTQLSRSAYHYYYYYYYYELVLRCYYKCY